MTVFKQKLIDKFYKDNGPCCAGCDNWRWQNAVIGECTKSLIISGEEIAKMLSIESCSANLGAGQALTKRDYVCGNFIDTHEWS